MKFHLPQQNGFAAREYDLPAFTVITGKNGSGKSRLLQLLKEDTFSISHVSGVTGHRQLFTSFEFDEFIDTTLEYARNAYNARESQVLSLAQTRDFIKLIESGAASYEDSPIDYDLHSYAAEAANKSLLDLTEFDVRVHFATLRSANIFSDFLIRCKVYSDGLSQNLIEKASGRPAYDELEFVEKFGASPWDLLNEQMLAAEFEYSFFVSDDRPRSMLTGLSYGLRSIKTGRSIYFDSLSTGEKIMLWVLIASTLWRPAGPFPGLYLFDEMDSALHPSAIKLLVDTVEGVLVRKFGQNAILVTHSPVTVVQAPEASLYTMVATVNGFALEKTSIDQTLSNLNAGLPLLRVAMDRRRIVFTESEYDAKFYEAVYRILENELSGDYSLIFVPSGLGGKSANAQSVMSLVTSLGGGGARNVFGVIDYDNKNRGTDFVKVLAEERAYTLENLLLDPILMALYIRKSVSDIKANPLGLLDFGPAAKWHDLEQVELQKLVDLMLSNYGDKHYERDEQTVNWNYKNGRVVKLPPRFLTDEGHKVVSEVSQTHNFGAIFGGTSIDAMPLQSKMALILLENPGWMSVEFLKLFKSLTAHVSQ